jgi:hypothetical protein
LSAAGWSSLVARRAHNPKVAGSNPAPATPERPCFAGPFVVLRRLLKSRKNALDIVCLGLAITRGGETLMTTGVGGWDPALLERLARLPERQAADMIRLFTGLAQAAEQRADAFAETAARVNSPAMGAPVPVLWG